MNDNELLLSISNLMDKKLKPIESRMDSIERKIDTVEKKLNAKIDSVEQKLNARIDSVEQKLSARIDSVEQKLSARIDSVEQKLSARIDSVESSVHIINLKLENMIEPRLSEIENCYLTTYERYKIENEKIEKMETDISILQSVVMDHHEKLQAQSA